MSPGLVSSPAGPSWFESGLLAGCGARAAFSTRAGGASPAPFESLNLGLHVGDQAERVLENRRRLWTALGLDPSAPAGAQQIHGDGCALVAAGDRGRGARNWDRAVANADGLVTTERGLPLFVLSADCALLALAAPEGRGCAAVHAGWRGLAAGVVERTAAVLGERSGCPAGELRAFVGPMLAEECFQVREDFVAAIRSAWGREEADPLLASDRSGLLHFRYDLAVRRRLDSAGVRPQNVEAVGLCTACRQDLFFSHRASGGRAGRMAMTVWMP
jgi:YfiH family protein